MPVVNRKSRFKRSFPTKEEQKILKKARVEAASLTSPEFKVLLSNSASTIVAFERFNSYVKEFEQRSEKEQRTSYDLIAEYLVSSPECKEIFNVISNKDLYSKFEIYHILKTLDSLLTALLKSSYKERFPSSAENICKQLAEGHFQKIYGLIISGKGRTNTTSIQLLTTVTAHGSLTTRLLFTNISFVREDVDALYNEKAVARFTKWMFGLLHTDTSELIEQVLSVLDKYVLSSTFITKTQRVKLFNITTVPQILECYNWHKSVKREKESTSQSEKPKVQSIVCEFVKSLLSNPKKCITFSDPEFGTGSRNMNHVVTHILVKSVLNNAYNDSQLEEVVVACLASRPDQLHRYLAVLEDSALPVKNTESWLTAANHVIKLMYSLPTFGHLVKHARTTSDDTLCNIALALSSPGLSTMKIFKHVLSMPELSSWQHTP
ncbi:URB1 [Bugula neritina]|uniref:URB1 n=1 Tax=Bugula neritina TaxID=10212 RepID=A0A7J7KTZ9_BUGNE|nr:URB1 [Bugula neritina]